MTRRKEEGDGEGDGEGEGEVPRVNLYECSVGHRLCFVLNFFYLFYQLCFLFHVISTTAPRDREY